MGKWGKGWQTGHKIDRKLRRKTIDVTARTKAIGVTKMAAATTTAAPRSAGVPVKPSTGTAWNNAPMSGAIRNAGRANGASWSGGMPNVVILTISLMRDGRHSTRIDGMTRMNAGIPRHTFFTNLPNFSAICGLNRRIV